MTLTESRAVSCPHCGESFDIVVDLSEGPRQVLTRDCEVCCHPMQLTVEWGSDVVIQAESLD